MSYVRLVLNGVSHRIVPLPPPLPPEEVERARQAKDVPADWLYTWCAAECGDFVFYPPTVSRADVPVKIVCSSDCLKVILDR
jgi:hypothetical protein